MPIRRDSLNGVLREEEEEEVLERHNFGDSDRAEEIRGSCRYPLKAGDICLPKHKTPNNS